MKTLIFCVVSWALAFSSAVMVASAAPDDDAAAPGAAQAAPAPPDETLEIDTDKSPYHVALFNYKSGKYSEARTAIEQAEKLKPGDPPILMLKARILTELHDYSLAQKTLDSLENITLPPNYAQALRLGQGDLALRQHHFDAAARAFETVLGTATGPRDPDILLRLIYAELGSNDLVDAGKNFSQLKPFDADHPSYYFAKAALDRSNERSADEEQDIQTVRTIYGVTVANRYLKTYLQVFADRKASPANLAPSGAASSGSAGSTTGPSTTVPAAQH